MVYEVLNILTDCEQKVIRDRYGFGDGKGKTLEEIGSDFGVTKKKYGKLK